MSENQEIIELLKSINNHLQELDEEMIAMGKRIEHMDNHLRQKEQEEEDAALYYESHPEEKVNEYDPQFAKIINGLSTINQNICTINSNGTIRNNKILDSLEEFKDEELSYFKTRTSHINKIYEILKSIHIWNG